MQIEIDEGTQQTVEKQVQEDTPSLRKWKRKRPRSRHGKKSTKQKSSEENNSILKEQNMNHELPIDLVVSEPSSRGSVLVDKVNESLDSIRKAYESRITALTKIPPKLQEYPNPREEKFRLVVH